MNNIQSSRTSTSNGIAKLTKDTLPPGVTDGDGSAPSDPSFATGSSETYAYVIRRMATDPVSGKQRHRPFRVTITAGSTYRHKYNGSQIKILKCINRAEGWFQAVAVGRLQAKPTLKMLAALTNQFDLPGAFVDPQALPKAPTKKRSRSASVQHAIARRIRRLEAEVAELNRTLPSKTAVTVDGLATSIQDHERWLRHLFVAMCRSGFEELVPPDAASPKATGTKKERPK